MRSHIHLVTTLAPGISSLAEGRSTAERLEQALAPILESHRKLGAPPLSLDIVIEEVDRGCYLTRSNWVLALLGFGNARLVLRVVANTAPGEEFSFRQHSRNAGLNIEWQDYLEDNGDKLLAELARRAAGIIGVKVRLALFVQSTRRTFARRLKFFIKEEQDIAN
ncbi:MAG: hypothetical protein AAF384_11935 [Pseudomonadota bacterium]